jgi:hypothetical protein
MESTASSVGLSTHREGAAQGKRARADPAPTARWVVGLRCSSKQTRCRWPRRHGGSWSNQRRHGGSWSNQQTDRARAARARELLADGEDGVGEL